VDWLDPAPAIARRVADLLHERPASPAPVPPPQIVFTSGRAPSPTVAKALAGYGFKPARQPV
jgi:glutamate racemase